eukprot:TRINITY_DN60289_c0_g1_i2.p1 TRINITY_DN60289_c0_g1~~TRINITY_DN60289_c0_g1_i2.p1  ORF type:complete len:144 (-),score=21.81 TRINITY_DN60289_c0_g1_i2:72-503(-)
MLGAVLAMLVAMAWYRPASWESCLATVFWVMDLHEASPGFWIRGDHMRSLEAWRAPEQDVFAVSFPKSGTHWTMQIITQLLAGGGREYESVHHVCTMMDLEALSPEPVSYTHLRAHETPEHLVCRLLLEKKKRKSITKVYGCT